MARDRGYQGVNESHFIKRVRRHRPEFTPREAYLPISTLPGEISEADWGHFGSIVVGRATYQLMAFVMVLAFSRAVFLRFFLGSRLREFLQGFADAFDFFGGVTRSAHIDNLRTGVVKRVDSLVRFHPGFLVLAEHYGFQPRAMRPYRPTDKGKVERKIRDIRTSFFEGRQWNDLNDLNHQALNWCRGLALERRWPNDRQLSVGDAYDQEKSSLLPLPEHAFPAEERLTLTSGKMPFVRFSRNDYSIPWKLVKRPVVLIASETRVRIEHNGTLVADHPRCYSKGERIENKEHTDGLRFFKKEGREHSGLSRLLAAVPEAAPFVEDHARRGENIGGVVASLLKILDTVGSESLRLGMVHLKEKGRYRLRALHHVLHEQERKRGGEPKIMPITGLSSKASDIDIQHGDLSHYDEITQNK